MCGTLPNNAFAFKNVVFLSPSDFNDLRMQTKSKSRVFVDIKKFILEANPLDDIQDGTVGLSSLQREFLNLSKTDEFPVRLAKGELIPINMVELEIDPLMVNKEKCNTDSNGLP